MVGIAVKMIEIYTLTEERTHAYVGILGDYALRFLQSKAKITNVFAENNAKPIGDGKAKETAYHFPSSRSALEAIGLWYKYAEKRKIQIFARTLHSIEGSEVFDLYLTSAGSLWVKTDHNPSQ